MRSDFINRIQRKARINFPKNVEENEFNNQLVRKRANLIIDKSKNENLYFIDILELYRIKEYIQSSKVLKKTNGYTIGKAQKLINIKIKKFRIEDVINEIKYNVIPYNSFHNILWDFISTSYLKRKPNKEKISMIEQLLKFYSKERWLIYPLKNNQILKFFSEYLIKLLLQNSMNAELYLSGENGVLEPRGFIKRGYRDKLFNMYLDSNNTNFNHVKQMTTIKNLSKDLKHKAIKKYDKENYILLRQSKGRTQYQTKFYVDMTPNFTRGVVGKMEGPSSLKCILNGKRLLNNLDYKSIMDSFIYSLGFVNGHFLINSLKKSNDTSSFIELISTFGDQNNYKYQLQASDYDNNYFYIFIMYFDFLNEHGINLEPILEWFYKSYLTDEYGADYFDDIDIGIDLPSYFYKCTVLVTQLHKVIRTYSEYAKTQMSLILIDPESIFLLALLIHLGILIHLVKR